MTEKNTGKNSSVYVKLFNIQQKLKAPKNQYNSFGKYNYRNCEDILQAVKPLLEENACVLSLNDNLIVENDRFYVEAVVCLICVETGQMTAARALARESATKKGMDSAQITGAASSYARKYALNGLFAIDDTKDPDNQDNRDTNNSDSSNTKSQPKPKNINAEITKEQKEVLNFIIETLAKEKTDESGMIVDVSKLKKIILDKYGQFPSKTENGKIVVDYIINELGMNKVTTKNDFLEGIE